MFLMIIDDADDKDNTLMMIDAAGFLIFYVRTVKQTTFDAISSCAT